MLLLRVILLLSFTIRGQEIIWPHLIRDKPKRSADFFSGKFHRFGQQPKNQQGILFVQEGRSRIKKDVLTELMETGEDLDVGVDKQFADFEDFSEHIHYQPNMEEFMKPEDAPSSPSRKRDYLRRYNKMVGFDIDKLTDKQILSVMDRLTDEEKMTLETAVKSNYEADYEEVRRKREEFIKEDQEKDYFKSWCDSCQCC